MQVQAIDVQTAKIWLDHQDVLLIDVREPAEFASQKIAQAKLYSQALDVQIQACSGDQKIVCIVKGHAWSIGLPEVFGSACQSQLFNLEGGLEAWMAAGLPIVEGRKVIMPLMQQVQLTIGLAVTSFGCWLV